MRNRHLRPVAVLLLLALSACGRADENGPDAIPTGNVVFVHPDGTGLGHWFFARAYWQGPDAPLAWDGLPEMAAYRGSMLDRLTATSNGGATAHAFGYRVEGPGSYGRDGRGAKARPILALSGFPGSILREAAAAGCPVGVVNDGDAAEPGTGAYLAEVGDRSEAAEIVRQILEGRPGHDDPPPVVVLGGGERFFLPEGTPYCASPPTLDEPDPSCAAHWDPVTGAGPSRKDGRNLVQEAVEAGWVVLRTRAAFAELLDRLAARPEYAPKVLGLFAADDIFNDEPEEVLIEKGLVDLERRPDDLRGRLVIWGGRLGTPGFDPPTVAAMGALALEVLDRHAKQRGRPFLLVAEVESTDNLSNRNNAIGTLRATKRADDLIGVARGFVASNGFGPTLVITAADSDAGAPQIVSPPPLDASGNVRSVQANPTGVGAAVVRVPLDGMEGRRSPPFLSAPDENGRQHPFAIAWAGTPDVAGGILVRAQGPNAERLREPEFSERFDNTDVYRLMYLTLFGRLLPFPSGPAPTRTEANR